MGDFEQLTQFFNDNVDLFCSVDCDGERIVVSTDNDCVFIERRRNCFNVHNLYKSFYADSVEAHKHDDYVSVCAFNYMHEDVDIFTLR